MRILLMILLLQILPQGGLRAQEKISIPEFDTGIRPERTFWGKAGLASAEVFGMEAVFCGVMTVLPKSITNWQDQFWLGFGSNFRRAYTEPPRWDQDPWYINYIGHPIHGANLFNSLRSQRCTFPQAAAFNLVHTLIWEYGIEALMEQPSIQDLITTPLAGIALGELFHYLTRRMGRGGFSTAEKVAVTLINPFYVINNGYK